MDIVEKAEKLIDAVKGQEWAVACILAWEIHSALAEKAKVDIEARISEFVRKRDLSVEA